MPVTRARPPTGRTARRHRAAAATSRSSTPAQRSTAAASADPPPSPAPAGMRLSTVTCAVRPTARSARRDEVVVVGRHVGAAAPHHQPVAVGERQRVGEVEAHHLGVDQVVAVGAHPGHPQRPGELGGRDHDVSHGRGPYVCARSTSGMRPRSGTDVGVSVDELVGEADPVGELELLGAGLGADAGGGEVVDGRRGRRASGGASCGAGRSRPRPGRTRPRRRSSSPGGRVAADVDERRLDPGRGDEHGRRHLADHRGVGPPGPPHRRDAVGLGAGAGGQALAHLELHHHQHPLDGRRAREQVEHERRGDVVRQVGHQHPRRVRRRAGAGQSSVMASASTTVAPAGSTTSRRTAQVRVHLDGGDVGAGLQQGQRERAEPGADLDHVVARRRRRRGGRCAAPCWRRPRSSAPAPATASARARRAARGSPTASGSRAGGCQPAEAGAEAASPPERRQR